MLIAARAVLGAAERVEALTAELAAAVAAPHRLHWLAVHARSLGPVPPLQLQQPAPDLGAGDPRGATLTRVAAFGTWRKLGYRVRVGGEGVADLRPGHAAGCGPDEVAAWIAASRDPFDADGRPRLLVRGFTVEYVFPVDRAAGRRAGRAVGGTRRADRGPRLHPRPTPGQVRGRWGARLVQLCAPKGVGQQRPRRGGTGADPGTRNRRAHPLRPEHHRDISRGGGGRPGPAAAPTWCSPRSAWTSAPPPWSAWPTGATGDTDLLRATAETVHRVAAAVLADLDHCDQPRETAA